ncbi:GNAT family N-acetyltransferase [Paenibacillus sepulcri]
MSGWMENRYKVKQLEAGDAAAYGPLTYQYVLPLLRDSRGHPSYTAIGAEMAEGAEAAGLIVIYRQPGSGTAEVVSLFVKPNYRRMGIGTALLRQTEELLLRAGATRIRFVYYAGNRIKPAVEAFLQRNNGSPPVLEGKVYTADTRIADAPWLKKIELPQGLQSLLWRDLDSEAKNRLREGGGFPRFLSPFKPNLQLEESNSLAMMAGEEISGWCMTYRIAEDTILYDSVYVQEPYRLYGCAFILMAQSVLLQLERQIPFAKFAVNVETPSMLKMLDRRLAPYACRIVEKRAVCITLAHQGGTIK